MGPQSKSPTPQGFRILSAAFSAQLSRHLDSGEVASAIKMLTPEKIRETLAAFDTAEEVDDAYGQAFDQHTETVLMHLVLKASAQRKRDFGSSNPKLGWASVYMCVCDMKHY